MNAILPAHSPLGASGAERWMRCPGSVTLLQRLNMGESDEPDYRRDGVRAHEVGAVCLTEKQDAWEFMDETFTEGHANAVQVYLDTMRPLLSAATSVRIEQRMHRPDLHKDYYGTADCALYFAEQRLLDITDYKHGEGIFVEVEGNPQIKYYAYGLLDQYPEAARIRLRIVQPRITYAKPVRETEITREELEAWARAELIPAMERTQMDGTLDAGEHCRFCPAKRVCPLLVGLFGAAMKYDPKEVVDASDATLGRQYAQIQGVKFLIAAIEKEAHARLLKGHSLGGYVKLVAKKAFRVWKAGSEAILKARLGEQAYTKPELKSPAEIEKVNPDAKALVKEWAYTPLTGTTVALMDDRRAEIKQRTAEEAFAGFMEKDT